MTVFVSFPFDVFFEISTNLDLEDVIHLSLTCRHLRALLLNDTVAHRVIETHHSYTEEARQARQGVTTYGEALCAIYDRRRAFSNAQPFSARVVGQGNSFLYRQGILCVQKNDTVIVSSLRSETPAVHINLPRVSAATGFGLSGDTYEMMYYSDEILAIHVTNEAYRNADDSLIQFIKTSNGLHDSERLITHVLLDVDSSRLFIRHTANYFCFGTHTGNGRDGHRKWVVKCSNYGYNTCEGLKKQLLLEDFHGNDIGSTVAFEIHDGYFYAVSNQGTYEVEEVDWTSFYHCIRFPLNDPVEDAMQKDTRVYRRQHAEGAIHDSWTDLTLQHDERTNALRIAESRREWVGASSQQARTFYTSRIDFSRPARVEGFPDIDCSNNNDVPPRPLPENDILATLLGSSHSANYMPTPKQYSWTRHPEFPPTSCRLPAPRSFILARTKFRAYNSSCSAFVDLVEDAQCCSDRLSSELPCLRLRIGSRRVAPNAFRSFDYGDGNSVRKNGLKPRHSSGARAHFEDDTLYRYTPVRMWPPARTKCPCSARLHHIMNPDIRTTLAMCSGQKAISAVCDERSIVYMVKPSHSYRYHNSDTDDTDHALGTIVLVDFGRTSTSTSSTSCTGQWRWEWTPGQHKRCEEGTC